MRHGFTTGSTPETADSNRCPTVRHGRPSPNGEKTARQANKERLPSGGMPRLQGDWMRCPHSGSARHTPVLRGFAIAHPHRIQSPSGRRNGDGITVIQR